MEPIGGYFELELPLHDNFPLIGGVYVNSGRNALEYILRVIGPENIRKLYLPRYTCEVILEPLYKLKMQNFTFYEVNDNLEIVNVPELEQNDYIIVNNYFGIKDKYIDKCVKRFGSQMIIDSSQALYYKNQLGLRIFYSPRKFVALPDGGIAWSPGKINLSKIDESYDRCSHMLKRIDCGPNAGYEDFHTNSSKLKNLPLMRMSRLTERLLKSIDYESVRLNRKQNYDILRNALQGENLLQTPESKDIACPQVYPFRTKDMSLRGRLIQEKIFVATYWPNKKSAFVLEGSQKELMEEILPLPIDQRYSSEDMISIINTINNG